jgi:pseudaminic acid synthase
VTDRVSIGGFAISRGHPPFVIAEMSGNHNGSLARALDLVRAAAAAGAHAIKLQTYTAETMTLDLAEREFVIEPPSPWAGRTLFDLYGEASTPWNWHRELLECAHSLGLLAFSTPFDPSAVEYLEELGVPAYKIASFELTDLPLIARVAKTGKPLILSTGMATLDEIDESVRVARSAGCEQLVLLKCTSTYPADPVDSNLLTIPDLRRLFDCEVGLSDHSLGTGVATASVALGATVVEKHLTLARADGGPDSGFSMEPQEFGQLSIEVKRAWQALGTVKFGPTSAEIGSLRFRRSLYFVRDVKMGELVSVENVRAIRPGFGLPPGDFDKIVGRPLKQSVPRGTPVGWHLL